MTTLREPPAHLVDAILRGRCIAFVGAGFSAMVMPTWAQLLGDLKAELGVDVELPTGASGFEYEALGQTLQDAVTPRRWEQAVRDVLARRMERAAPAARAQLDERNRLLTSIPFKAILTTNVDPSLPGRTTSPGVCAQVLREERRWWFDAPAARAAERPETPILKLHGHANGDPDAMPLVLSRTAYRKRLYDDHNYGNFLRAAFAGYTVLFLGVSFTDAYLNELRSEVLNLVRRPGDRQPWGYAVMYRATPTFRGFLARHEGIEVLPIDEFAELDQWLAGIAARTSLAGRLTTLLAGKRVVWVDEGHDRTERGRTLLLDSGARVEALAHDGELDDARHAGADLLITQFGHGSGRAFAVLERVRAWPERPPVIVFAGRATPEQVAGNREACLRRGACEYAVEWGELYRAIEQVLGRIPGRDRR